MITPKIEKKTWFCGFKALKIRFLIDFLTVKAMVTPFGQIWSDHQLSWLSILWRPNLEATWCTETTFWMVWRASETTLLPPNLAFFMISLCLTAMVTLLALIWSDDQPRWPPGLLWPTLEDIWLPQTTLQMVWRAQEKTTWHPNQAYFLIFQGLACMVTLFSLM